VLLLLGRNNVTAQVFDRLLVSQDYLTVYATDGNPVISPFPAASDRVQADLP
jgi:hypothetical protein